MGLRPRIAGYCRVAGPGEKEGVQSPMPKVQSDEGPSVGRQKCRSYRFVPASTAWYRLVPPGTAWDRINFFLRVKTAGKRWSPDCGRGCDNTTCRGCVGKSRIMSLWNYRRHARGEDTIRLNTGGKGVSGSNSLFEIHVTATSISDPRYEDQGGDLPAGSTSIPYNQIAIGGFGAPGADGTLWVAVPDGSAGWQ
jgi:hypothetical protein